MKKDANGAPDSFRSFIEKIKMERIRKQCLSDVELDPSLNHFIWNGLHTIQYQIISGDCEDIAKLIPKRELFPSYCRYSSWFNIPNIEYDSNPYTYQAFSKVVTGFLKVTTSLFWRFCDISFRHTIGVVIIKLQGKIKINDAAYMVRH